MNWYRKTSQTKTMIIMRGLSGSGKSTLARQLGEGGQVFSTDDFFMYKGDYFFDPMKIGDAHKWNIKRVDEAASKGVSPLVVDNTNVEAWEAKAYVNIAQKHGYSVQIQEAQTPWRFDADELAKRNTHGVPRDAIQTMLDKWQHNITVDDILKSQPPTGMRT